jgi:hypothetical protein
MRRNLSWKDLSFLNKKLMEGEKYQYKKGDYRVGICKHTYRQVVQLFDETSDDAIDEFGWFCLHDESIQQELANVCIFLIKKLN